MSSVSNVLQGSFSMKMQNFFSDRDATLIKIGVGLSLGFAIASSIWVIIAIADRRALFEKMTVVEDRSALALKIGAIVFAALFIASLFLNYPLELALPVIYVAVVLIPHEISKYICRETPVSR